MTTPASPPNYQDTTGEVSGTWVLGRSPSTDPGLIVSIMVAECCDNDQGHHRCRWHDRAARQP